MKTFYNALHEVFEKAENRSKFTEKGLTVPKVIDLYAGQDYNPEFFNARPLPAVFVSWDIDYKTEPYTATIQIRLAYEQLRDTSNISLNKEKALSFFDLADTVDEIVKTIQTEETGTLTLTHEGQELEPTVVDVYILDYECSYFGKNKTRQRETLPGEIDDVGIDKNIYKSILET